MRTGGGLGLHLIQATSFGKKEEGLCNARSSGGRVRRADMAGPLRAFWGLIVLSVIAIVGVAPCQCFKPGGNQTASPGLISSIGPPSVCTQPSPDVTIRVWPIVCVCHGARHHSSSPRLPSASKPHPCFLAQEHTEKNGTSEIAQPKAARIPRQTPSPFEVHSLEPRWTPNLSAC